MQILKRGDRGAIVDILQLGLIRSGYLKGPADGIFGPATQAALLRFQKRFGLTATGETDAPTWEYLKRFVRGFFVKEAAHGDTLWGLAAQYGATLAGITAANPDVDPLRIPIGAKLVVPFGYPVTPDDVTWSYALLEWVIEGLKARYPFLKTQSMGQSAAGKEIPVLGAGYGENALFISASIHADEWINTPVLLTFLESWLSAYVNGKTIGGADARQLFTDVKCVIAPMVNPDGVDLVAGALRDGPYYEEAVRIARRYPDIAFPEGWKANIEGVDLNLQFPANWERAREIKFAAGYTSPAPRDYVGRAPLTAPEARAMAAFTNENDFRMILAYHTQGRLIYWKYLDYLPADGERIGRALSDASGYRLALTPEDSAYAGFKDWFIETFDRPGYTVETGQGTNPLPLAQFNGIYQENLPLLLTALCETAAMKSPC